MLLVLRGAEDSVDEWRLVWDGRADSRDYSPGSTVHPDPNAAEKWKFLITLNDRHTLRGLATCVTRAFRMRRSAA